MQNLRILAVQIVDSSNITVTFTESITPNLIPANISILSQSPNVPDSLVLSLRTSQNALSLVCQPLTPLGAYFLQFQSVPQHPFQSLNGDAIVPMDGVTNKFLITGPLSPDNPILNYLGAFFNGSIYDGISDPNSIVSKYINSLAINLSRALYDIGQLKNENYLELDIIDEQKQRGAGPFDRLNQEGAYEVTRVGRGPTGATTTAVFQFTDFPSYPITLQRQLVVDNLSANSVDLVDTFNINSLTLNLKNSPVTRVDSVVFTLNTANPVYTYNIPNLGYQILSARYDQDFGFTYLQLAPNQIRLSDKILADPLFSLDSILNVRVNYEYKNQGIIVDPTTVTVTTILQSIREVLPPIINVFNLQHAPILDASGNVAVLGGVIFTDPNQAFPGALHPAFLSEIPFRLNALPSTPGTYSIDYNVGKVYVYGADLNNDGTGPFPPLATYSYLFTYKSEQDYVYDTDLADLVALPVGNLLNNAGNINFKYEQVLVPGVDYQAELHIESLEERVANNLVALNVINAQHSPITNVFRIFNETSGEIYTLNRWYDNKVYFKFNNPPNVVSTTGERVTFDRITNELLFVNSTLININSLRIFKLFLNNNTITAGTEDTIASSFNTSMTFSSGTVFLIERWFDREFTESPNINRLQGVGEYMVDYVNGVVYVAVSSTQGQNIGTVSYKDSQIDPQFPHVVSVEDIYYRISPLLPKNVSFAYTSFADGAILPAVVNPSDELFLNANATAPYQVLNGSVGVFINATFVPGVTYQVKFVRSVFEYSDLRNSTRPINFADVSASSGFNITVSPINKQAFENVQFDGTHYFVTLNENIPYLSPDITYSFSIVRASDSAQLWNNSGTIVPGNPLKLILPGINSPHTGDLVSVNYSFAINDLSRVVVDYNKGDLFVDYTYVADEIILSYEYGDNVLDFRQGQALSFNDPYFVSYKAGALRDALLKNFGTLINVPELANVNLNFDRQRYREALQAALTSFIQGPTVAAIKNIGKVISHIEPQVTESAFQGWTLGTGILNPKSVTANGAFQLLPVKFGNGALINVPGQTVSLPANSNLRLEDGTFETWILPQWNGLDNDATLTFSIVQDGYAIDPGFVFIGAEERHPVISSTNTFSVDKLSLLSGKPNTNKDGIFIYYDRDMSGAFNRWYIRVIDGYVDGYASSYKINIKTTGAIYDNKSITFPKPSNMSFFTGTSNITLNISAGGSFDEGITFLSDPDHYILDFGHSAQESRLSIYKDASGYLNFRAIDKDKRVYMVSADVSSWQTNQLHMVAASWKLNTRNSRDEMHLFIDGFEVPNIIKYGQKLQPYLHEKFRTVDPEEILGLVNRDIVGSSDLSTTAGSNVVSSSLNFSSFNIFVGDTIFIDELGFDPMGYIIQSINGQTLVLSAAMPLTLPSNGRFSVNRTQFTVTSEIDIYPNITVSTIHTFITGSDITGTMNSPVVTSANTNFSSQNVQPGFSIRIDNTSLAITYTIVQVSGHSLTISDNLPSNISPTTFQVYSNVENEISGVRALFPAYSISKDINFQNILTVSNDVFAGDLVLIRTLGLNFRDVKKQYYVWSSETENILMTQLPPPISLDEADITRIILPSVAIGSSNSTLVGGGFVSNPFPAAHPSNAQAGRTLSITLSGNNVDFSMPAQVTINGDSGYVTVTDIISFSDYGTLDSVHPFISINYVQINVKPINPNKNAVVLQVQEKYPITRSEFSGLVPVVRFSYHIGGGYTLQSDGYNTVRDNNNHFSALDVGNYLIIHSPPSVAGYYIITAVSLDLNTLTIQPTITSFKLPLASFSNGIYQVLDTTQFRSGLQNGFFTLENKLMPGQPYFLGKGFYELDYSTYATIKFNPNNQPFFLGSDLSGNNQANAALSQVKIYSIMLTDTRIGENIPANQRSITKDFNSLKPLKNDANTLVSITFNSFPFTNEAPVFVTTPTDRQHFPSSIVVNENFGQSLVITDTPIVVSNAGILDTKKEGTIEFWVNPLFDTANDPQVRTYFDAFGAVLENAVSINDVSVKISAPASQILSVKLQSGDPNIDYFAGGKLEIDTQRAIQEETISLNANAVVVSQPILQVITVKIAGDFTGVDYFQDGSIGTDQKTIYLGRSLPQSNLPLIITYQAMGNGNNMLNTQVIRLNRKLPNQNTPVIVNYLPKGLQGDRIQLFKDQFGYFNFNITASGTLFSIRAPIFWSKGTWHRVKASYKINGGISNDITHLFIDGYSWNNFRNGFAPIGKYPAVAGSSFVGDGYEDGYGQNIMGNIRFRDPINDLFIGTDYTGRQPIFSLIDNFRISNLSRPLYKPLGIEPIDVNWTNNLSVAEPVTSDLFTTYLLNFNTTTKLADSFATLVNRATGTTDFAITIFDELGFVASSPLVKETLEALLQTLKPANSRIYIKYD